MKRVLRIIIRSYQLAISPAFTALGGRCRFHPTCSEYAMSALSIHPAHRAIILITKRLLKCGPWNAGGVDFVPCCGKQY